MEIVNEALKDEKLREITGAPPNPIIAKKLLDLADQLDRTIVKSKGKAGAPQGAQPTPKSKTPEQRYNELKNQGVSEDVIYRTLAREGYR
jgi:hypothetical protein